MKIIPVLLMSFLLGFYSNATGELRNIVSTLERDTRAVGRGTISLFDKGLPETIAFTSLVVGLAVNRREVHTGMKKIFGRDSGGLSKLEFLGDSGVAAGIGALFVVGGLEFESPREFETGIMIIESYFFTGIAVILGQVVLAEERPVHGGDMHFFRTDGHGVSGHAALAATLVCPIAHQYLESDPADGGTLSFTKKVLKATLWGLPVLTGLSRIERDYHYAWNVALGFAIGYGIGHMIVKSHEEARATRTRGEDDVTRPCCAELPRLRLGPGSLTYMF